MSTQPRPEPDPSRHLDLDALAAAWESQAPAPKDEGTVTLLVARLVDGQRHVPDAITVTVNEGMPGDRWHADPARDSAAQLAVQGHRIASLIANGQSLSLFGDNLTLDLDLSEENLPTGTLLEIGGAAFVVTPKPHNGCRLYRGRFGGDALQFISAPVRRHERLRGIYLRVVMPGEIRVGDTVHVSRPAVAEDVEN